MAAKPIYRARGPPQLPRHCPNKIKILLVLLEELPTEYGDLLLHTEIRWLSRGRILLPFLSLLSEIKEFMQSRGEDTALLEDTDWTLDLAFLMFYWETEQFELGAARQSEKRTGTPFQPLILQH
ncbi:Zinc finger BED domain-containing protein 5 [Takifugu flavidus]|uniref:Zinc finger BED domain-containing protein 5 n=1 Tax=Takifugu flavidus TaxID=433684 RepID=A0A5C6MIM6_9TELE|nr:Zinc finger BED domain-containing protein 5 [Takifugu flavidus]